MVKVTALDDVHYVEVELDGGTYTVHVYHGESPSAMYPNGMVATVNFPAIGSVNNHDAYLIGEAITKAAEIARELNDSRRS